MQLKNIIMQKLLLIDRDGVIINEPIDDPQIDSFCKLKFCPNVFTSLHEIYSKLNYKLVMVTNQDGLGTNSFPEKDFWPIQNFIMDTLLSEGIVFDEVHIDRSFEHENSPNRKPGIGMVKKYLSDKYDIENSIVIGDRITDLQLAKNLGAKAIRLNGKGDLPESLKSITLLDTNNWKSIQSLLIKLDRKSKSTRTTKETMIDASINIDGNGHSVISTGLAFFDHMLEQIAKHSNIDMFVNVKGDLNVDEHHTIEDTAIVLGELLNKAFGKKAGINRYGFSLPMDESEAHVLIDCGGRYELVWNVKFKREKIGDVPTEMFYHFFKSLCENGKINLNIKAKGSNEHHKIESIFKAFARTLRQAITIENDFTIPSTKGII